MAAANQKAAAGDQAAEQASEPTVRTDVVVQWPQASVFIAADKDGSFPDTVKIPNTGATREVSGGWVTLRRGEALPAEAADGQGTLLLEIGAAAGVAVSVQQ